MTQAIVTKYFGPGNVRGSRIKAEATAGYIWHSYDHALNVTQNHDVAARKLCENLGWTGTYVRGGMPSGYGNVYVCQYDDKDNAFTL